MLSFYLAALESGGDRKIFAEIYQRYHVKMERTAMNILRDQSEAEALLSFWLALLSLGWAQVCPTVTQSDPE